MPEYIDPNQFVITRKRKKYRFAKFHNAANCFEFEQWRQRPVDVIEIGAGNGLFSVELAARHPEKTYLALDVKADRLQKGAYAALERGFENVFFVRARADQISELVSAGSVQELWLTFADPFPKARSSGRRMTHPVFLKKYQQLLSRSGALYIKHDNPAFFAWSLEQLVEQKWSIDQLSFDLHMSELPDDYKIMTSYEQRWTNEGRIVQLVRARV